VLALAMLPTSAGCLRHYLARDDQPDALDATATYYQEAVAHSAPAYATGVDLEIPDSPPPLTVTNPEGEEKWELTLREAIEIALKNSGIVRQLRGGIATAVATAWDPSIAETRVQEELARFDTSLIMNLFWGNDEQQLNNNISPGGVNAGAGAAFKQNFFGGGRGTGFQNTGDTVSLRKQTGVGTIINVGLNADYTVPNLGDRLFKSGWETRAFVSIQQPLLNSYGEDVNRAPIVIARLRSDQELWEFKRAVMQLVRDVEQKYWELYASQWQYWATNEAIKTNREIVRRLDLLLQEGRGSATDRDEAEVQYHQLLRQREFAVGGQELVSGARVVGVLVQERQLRGLLGLPPNDGRRIVAIDDPNIAPVQCDWSGAVGEAFTFNPEIQRLKLAVAEQRQIVRAAKNNLLPRLDVFARYEMNGLGSNIHDSTDQLTDGTFTPVSGGIQFQYTFGYRQQAAQMQRAMDQISATRALLRDKGREVQSDLAQNIGELEVRYEAYKASANARLAAARLLENQTMLHQEGQLPIDRLLQTVRSHADAVNNEVQDRIQYQIALTDLELAKGTILRYNSVHIQEGPWPAAAYRQSAKQVKDRERGVEWHHSHPRSEPAETIRVYDGTDGFHPKGPHTGEPAPELLPAPYYGADSGPQEIPLRLTNRNTPTPTDTLRELVLPAGLDDGAADTTDSAGIEVVLPRD
jgi:outer membrane protein TolC